MQKNGCKSTTGIKNMLPLKPKRFFFKLLCLVVYLCFIPKDLQGAELRPWFTDSFVLYTNEPFEAMHFSRLDTGLGEEKSHNTILSYRPSLQFTYADYTLEVEASFSKTRQLSFSSEYFAQTFRYLLKDDVAGDCYSAAAGATYRQVSRQHLLDIAQIHHGQNELDFHISFGKEFAPCYDWIFRSYMATVLSIADHGSAWFTLRGGMDFHLDPCSVVELSAKWQQGFGKDPLLPLSFSGYGSLDYHFVDLQAKYLFCFCEMDAGIWLRGRCVAKNAPQDLFALGLEFVFTIPFL